MVATAISPTEMLANYRKSDAVIIVCQNHEKQVVEIAALNEEAQRVTGFSNDTVLGQPLRVLLPDRIAAAMAEYIEYGADQNDLQDVLMKVRDFAIRDVHGKEKEFRLRIVRGEAGSLGTSWFHLVLVNEEKLLQSTAFKSVLKENLKGHEVLDPISGLPDRNSIIKDLEMVIHWVNSRDITASFAILDINHYERYKLTHGAKNCEKLHHYIGQLCKQKLRSEDTIGTLSDKTLGVILIDAEQEPARMVLNRLRWNISVSPLEIPGKDAMSPQTNIAFAQINGSLKARDIIDRCEKTLKSMSKHTSNIQLVETGERRKGEDRRKQDIPVDIDRRRKDRRKETQG